MPSDKEPRKRTSGCTVYKFETTLQVPPFDWRAGAPAHKRTETVYSQLNEHISPELCLEHKSGPKGNQYKVEF